MNHLLAPFAQSISSISAVIFLLNALLHVMIAAGVAKDVGHRNKRRAPTHFIPGIVWVLSALIGGILLLAVYWLIHYSSLARFRTSEDNKVWEP